jgi:hypothetical protein
VIGVGFVIWGFIAPRFSAAALAAARRNAVVSAAPGSRR